MIASPVVESARLTREAHRLVRDLMRPRLARYWIDFLVTIVVVYVSFVVYISARSFTLLQTAAFVTCGLAMYRAVVFTHEITHRRGPAFWRFTFVWNLLCGIPFLMPSFMYGNHQGHHTSDAYGTWSDPEYLLHSSGWRLKLSGFLLLPVIYPILIAGRFLFFTPLALASRRVGPYTLQAAIAALHAGARSASDTDWNEIVGLYDVLTRVAPSPVVALNRAVAVAMRDGPVAGLAVIDGILADGTLAGYHLAHSARADLCRRLGRMDDARASYQRALTLARQEPEQRFLRARLAGLDAPPPDAVAPGTSGS